MSKINEKQTISQTSIKLKDVDSEHFKNALIESGFIDEVQNEQSITNLVQICFQVDDYLLEIEESTFDKSIISCFFKGYYDICKYIHYSSVKLSEIPADEIKSLISDSRMYENIIDIDGLLGFYGSMLILFDTMYKNEFGDIELKRRIVSIVYDHNHFLKLLISKK